MDFFIGEALLGEGNEIAHVDVLVGDKDGPVGSAFANALSQLSAGHTPLLAVIRPNLAPKPQTLIIPKVTIKNMDDASRIFGPAQVAVAKAVADSLEEGIIPRSKADTWVIIASVFIHPKARNNHKIYQYNYSATRLALKRAVNKDPSIEAVLYDKDRAIHPFMGYRVPRLWRPPYLQIALDNPTFDSVMRVIKQIPKSDRIILEVGTPLVKSSSVEIINKIREETKGSFIVADLKTLDVGKVEVDVAFNATADAVVASGLASTKAVDNFVYEAKRLSMYSYLDMMNVPDPLTRLKELKDPPDVVILHRAIDAEKKEGAGGDVKSWGHIKPIKAAFKDKKLLVAVAGGIRPHNAPEALKAGADIIIVGRYITQSRDVDNAVREFLPTVGGDIDLFRVHTE